jgi:hypothetical protein
MALLEAISNIYMSSHSRLAQPTTDRDTLLYAYLASLKRFAWQERTEGNSTTTAEAT